MNNCHLQKDFEALYYPRKMLIIFAKLKYYILMYTIIKKELLNEISKASFLRNLGVQETIAFRVKSCFTYKKDL